MADVFVSYRSHRRAAVEHLACVLELNGYSVWFDHALLAGEVFAPPIERELRAARAVIVTWCSLSVESDWVREEASLAKRLRTIIPVRLERVDPPLGFATLHTLDLSKWDGAPRSHIVDKLILEVARLVGRDPAPKVRDLLEFDKVWRRSGAPTMQRLIDLGPATTAKRTLDGVPVVSDAGGPSRQNDAALVPSNQQHDGKAINTSASGTKSQTDTPQRNGRASLQAIPGQSPFLLDGPSQTKGRGALAVQAAETAPPTRRRRAFPSLPDKPSLVVLPFATIGGDAEQDYFADGLTEEITAEVARLRWFFVIARNSAFTYKGKAVDVRQIGRELGVRYALEGSVRRAGRQIRIAGRLVDTETGHMIWTDRFDGDIDQIFELQDRVTAAVAGALEPTLREAEIGRAQRKPTKNLDAYDLYLRALPHYHAMTENGTAQAQALLRGALKLSPGFALGKSLFAACQVRRQGEGWARADETAQAIRFAREAVAEAPGDPTVLGQCGVAIAYLDYAHPEALRIIERAISICPNSALVEGAAGLVHAYACRPEPAIKHLLHAMRLSPLDPWTATFLMGIATAHQVAGRLEDALSQAEASIQASPNFGAPRRLIVATLAMLGRIAEARAAAEELHRLVPAAYHVFADRILARNPDKAFAKRLIEAYRAAGMPE